MPIGTSGLSIKLIAYALDSRLRGRDVIPAQAGIQTKRPK